MESKHGFRIASFLTMAVGTVVPALAGPGGPTIVPLSSNLLPNTAGQQLKFLITGTDQLTGEDLNFQINDGLTGPQLITADILTGTIFGTNNTGQNAQGVFTSGTYAFHLAIMSTTTTPNGTVSSNGLLATLTISTGAAGTFQINLLSTLNGDSVVYNNLAEAIVPHYANNLFSIGAAPDRQWITNGGGTWQLNSNWTPFAPYATGDQANFLGALTSGTATVTLDGDRTAGSVNFNNAAGSYTISSGTGGALVMNNGLNTPTITDSGGNHTISAFVKLVAPTSVSVTNAGDTLTMSGVIDGAFNLSLAGAGKVVLGGTNTYGTTTINAGMTLQAGMGGTDGTVGLGAITDNGTLAFNRSDAVSISNAIAGSGGISHIGPGTTTLTSAANYTGATSIGAGKLAFGGGAAHSVKAISGAGTVQVEAGSSLTSDLVTIGTWNVNGTQMIRTNASLSGRTNTATSLNIPGAPGAWTGKLDLTNNNLIVVNGSNVASQIKQAANLGAWNGTGGITSSKAAAASSTSTATALGSATGTDYTAGNGLTLFDGHTFAGTDVLVKYTLAGDANMDGSVTFADFLKLQNNYNQANTNWERGDWNFDGSTTFADFLVLQNNYNKVLGVASLAGGGSGAVPEPAALSLMGMGAATLLIRKRRRVS